MVGGIFLSGNRPEIAQVAECATNNEKLSGSIPGSVTFSHYWFKNYSAFYTSFSVIFIVEEIFYRNFQFLQVLLKQILKRF